MVGVDCSGVVEEIMFCIGKKFKKGIYVWGGIVHSFLVYIPSTFVCII